MSGYFLKGIEDVRAQEWSRTYLWDIKFPDLAGMDWFPALDVEEARFSLQSHEVAMHQAMFKFPLSSGLLGLKITFAELADHRISNWLTDWVQNGILNGGRYISTLEDSVKQVTVVKLNPDRTKLSEKTYLVYPEGDLFYHGSSESNVEMIAQDFIIVGS